MIIKFLFNENINNIMSTNNIEKYFITDSLRKLNLQYGHGNLFDYNVVQKGCVKPKGSSYLITHVKTSTETWLEYFLKIRGDNTFLWVDCTLTKQLVKLFNSPSLYGNIIEFILYGPGINNYPTDFFLVTSTAMQTLSKHIKNIHPGIHLLQGKNGFIGLGYEGLVEASITDWNLFLDKDAPKFINHDKSVNKDSDFYAFKFIDYTIISTNNKIKCNIVVHEETIDFSVCGTEYSVETKPGILDHFGNMRFPSIRYSWLHNNVNYNLNLPNNGTIAFDKEIKGDSFYVVVDNTLPKPNLGTLTKYMDNPIIINQQCPISVT